MISVRRLQNQVEQGSADKVIVQVEGAGVLNQVKTPILQDKFYLLISIVKGFNIFRLKNLGSKI